MNALTDMQLQTWQQHGRNYFSILQHVNDAALEIFTAVGLQVATETDKEGAKHGAKEKKRQFRGNQS